MRLLLILSALLVSACYSPVPSAEAQPLPEPPITRNTGGLPSLAPLVEDLSPAVVNVNIEVKANPVHGEDPLEQFRFFFDLPDTTDPQPRQGQGSGFLISSDGYLLTNHHVVQGADRVSITFQDGDTRSAEVVGTDPRTDIALLKVEGRNLPHVPLGQSESLRVGDWVVAIGNPFGLGHTVTAGIISGKGRALGAGPYDDFLQTDAAINPGNSGGPLFNLNGEVVGINTAVVPRANTIGFSIPIDMVSGVIDELKSSGSVARGWLGVSVQSIDEALVSTLNLGSSQGALVGEVHEATPASRGGLKANDVVTAIDGKPLKDHEALVRAIGSHHPGDSIVLTIRRESKTLELKISLEERPEESSLQSRYLHRKPR